MNKALGGCEGPGPVELLHQTHRWCRLMHARLHSFVFHKHATLILGEIESRQFVLLNLVGAKWCLSRSDESKLGAAGIQIFGKWKGGRCAGNFSTIAHYAQAWLGL